jgi:hypothetical protein
MNRRISSAFLGLAAGTACATILLAPGSAQALIYNYRLNATSYTVTGLKANGSAANTGATGTSVAPGAGLTSFSYNTQTGTWSLGTGATQFGFWNLAAGNTTTVTTGWQISGITSYNSTTRQMVVTGSGGTYAAGSTAPTQATLTFASDILASPTVNLNFASLSGLTNNGSQTAGGGNVLTAGTYSGFGTGSVQIASIVPSPVNFLGLLPLGAFLKRRKGRSAIQAAAA